MLADIFVKAQAGALKVAVRKSDVFKIMQRNDEMQRDFMSRFHMERIELPPAFDDWAVKAFMQGLNERSSIASRQLKQNLIEYPAMTWLDVHNRYQSKIKIRSQVPQGQKSRSRFNKERHQPYADRRRNGPSRNTLRSDRRNNQSQNSRGLMSKSGFDKHSNPAEAPRLLEYNFNIDALRIVSAIGGIKDTEWPRPIQTDPYQRNPNLMCKYHGTHGHRTEDCRQLREELARLFNEGLF
ncbi:PREDICTED: uncharacterized protein LOC109238202 [Nicotiana attenuata]|uniref:uncharacterized protein LOC109238202 n=1 Tax=Nicotiana attenuata TaxID=49451 RepID=UPI00090549F1|nr:PREDICTED: uncharacterized protein LOC109238202 [Nicotiana attenuata]